MNNQQLYSISDCAQLLGIEEHRINYSHRSRKVPEPSHFAGRRMYRLEDIERLAQHFNVDLQDGEGGEKCS